jgi:hypothetical protein
MEPGGKTENPPHMLALGPFTVNGTEDRLRLSSGRAQMENDFPDLCLCLEASDGNRTRTISLGICATQGQMTWRHSSGLARPGRFQAGAARVVQVKLATLGSRQGHPVGDQTADRIDVLSGKSGST